MRHGGKGTGLDMATAALGLRWGEGHPKPNRRHAPGSSDGAWPQAPSAAMSRQPLGPPGCVQASRSPPAPRPAEGTGRSVRPSPPTHPGGCTALTPASHHRQLPAQMPPGPPRHHGAK